MRRIPVFAAVGKEGETIRRIPRAGVDRAAVGQGRVVSCVSCLSRVGPTRRIIDRCAQGLNAGGKGIQTPINSSVGAIGQEFRHP